MPRLHVDQAVTLSLDDVEEAIECRVLEFEGPGGRLAYRYELPPQTIGALVHGAHGYAVFDEFGAPVGLRVSVRARPPYLDVAITDRIDVPERRGGERVKLGTRARMVLPDGPDRPAQWTYTLDLSERGALLRSHAALEGLERLTLELMFGDDPEPITAQAAVIRRVDDTVAVAFESVAVEDAARLGGYLMGIRHQRRAAARN